MLKKYLGLKQKWSKTTLRDSSNATICFVCNKRFGKYERFNKCEFYTKKQNGKDVSFWCQNCTPVPVKAFLKKVT